MAQTLVELTTEIVSAHASTVEMSSDELLKEIQSVYATLKALGSGNAPSQTEEATTTPTMAPKKSIQKNQVVCLICGKAGLKTLTRHLKSHNMTPGQYRKQFGLPAGTSLVAKGYSESRRQQALKNNLAGNLEKARASKGKKQAPAPASKPKTVVKKKPASSKA